VDKVLSFLSHFGACSRSGCITIKPDK
jgi:hypothetical protein